VVRPQIVYGPQCDALLTLGPVALQDLLPPCMNLIPLSLERDLIAVQEDARVQVPPLYQALERVWMPAASSLLPFFFGTSM
jgi:hypothetical protein